MRENRKPFLMNFIIVMVGIVTVCCLSSCDHTVVKTESPSPTNHEFRKICVIDGCDYVEEITYGHYIYVHRGNCRACWARMDALIKTNMIQMRLENKE
jgi:hypothetical protein